MASGGVEKGKLRTALDEVSEKGAFVRSESIYRSFIGKDERYPAAEGRYHLYVSLACPWASRCLAVRALKGLEHAIGVSVVHPTWQRTRPDDPDDQHSGWVFRAPGDPPLANTLGHGEIECDEALVPDVINDCKTVRELYELCNDTDQRYTVPVLFDTKTKAIVNNESSEIIEMFNDAFNGIAKHPEVNLFPKDLKAQMDEVDGWVYNNINNGVYKCGFAKTQSAYDNAFLKLFENLDRAELLLSKQRFLCGDRLTASDIRLAVTLWRFDEIYVVYFKTNKYTLESNYPNLYNYAKDIYQQNGVGSTMNMKHCKTHYFTSHPHLNTFGIIPVGRHGWSADHFGEQHDRDRFL
eukprot:CAMPEP_0119159962 /NCGR_PEP_ID=MMETSP1310-20130426/54021_1 /TAXON_ID=464262 /ORGANISM="Genus nov. species nov., Strain RCC2339" /LENGTH=351 /DNA_ID=CAMNT_0007152591 /DNA_START=79 /DNA_END=1134 /DNA_ORIENTATION=+